MDSRLMSLSLPAPDPAVQAGRSAALCDPAREIVAEVAGIAGQRGQAPVAPRDPASAGAP